MRFKKYSGLILIVLSVTVKSGVGKKKSADQYFDLCHRNDPEINLCILNTMRKVTTQVVSGIPDIGIPTLDPLFIKHLKMVEGNGNFKIFFVMSNVTVKGLNDVSVQKFSINLKNESNIVAKFEAKAPWMHYSGKYELDGKILLVPAQGNGDYYMNMTQPYMKATLLCHTRIDPKNNKKYIYVDAFKWDITIKGGKTHFYNLFNGNKVLGDTVNNFFQSNALDLFNLIKHLPEREFGLFFKDVVNDFFRRFTYDELFLRD